MRVTDFVFLLVEDDPDQILLIQRAFADANLVNPLRVVRDGAEAVEYLAGDGAFADRTRHPLPSLILLDLRLPKKSGLEVLEWLRADPALKATPVVVLTSSSEPTDIERCHALGVNAYLVKPVRFADLLELVKGVGMYWMILNRSEVPRKPPAPERA
ncbi:MAG TPA: response regulator [Planctomycetota bacterium]